MGRGQSKASGGRDWGEGGSGANADDIKDRKDLVSQRNEGTGAKQKSVDDVLTVARSMNEQYGEDGLIYQFESARMVKSASMAMAVYDGQNIVMNDKYMNSKGMDAAYDAAVKSGFHPSRGNKSGTEAVAAHEYGHALTDAAARKMGISNMDAAANRIMTEARAKTRTKGLAGNISRYATTNAAEAIAEAVSDVYCNGTKASGASKSVVKVLNKYIKG